MGLFSISTHFLDKNNTSITRPRNPTYLVYVIRKVAFYNKQYVDLKHPRAKVFHEIYRAYPTAECWLFRSWTRHDAKSGPKVVDDLRKVPGVIDLKKVEATLSRGAKFVPPPQALSKVLHKNLPQCRPIPPVDPSIFGTF